MTQFDWNYEKYLKDNTNNSIKRKTALDWFIEQLEEHLLAENTILHLKNTEAYELAKQLEKAQIVKAYQVCYMNDGTFHEAEYYYNETYGK